MLAKVKFTRNQDEVEMTLSIDEEVVLVSRSHETVVRELQIRRARQLIIDDLFSTELPTSERTLRHAGSVPFPELMSALMLIAACAATGESATLPAPARRFRSRAVVGRFGHAR